MTRQETGVIMDVLRTAYPRYYAGQSVTELRNAVNLWTELFAGDDVRVVAAAVKALIATDDKGFPPHIGAVKAKLRQITQPQQMLPAEAWGLVWKAIQRSAYHSREEFEALPPTLRRLVGTPEQLKAWSQMDADTVQSVISSNFQRSYQARVRQEQEFQALPADVRQMMGAAAERLSLEGGGVP